MHDEKPGDIRLTLRALPSDVPPEIRLKKLLKGFLRSFEFRCVNIETVPADAPTIEVSDASTDPI